MGCSNLLYYPTRRKYVDLNKTPHPPEEVRIKSPYGQLAAWHFKSAKNKPKAVIVFAHGNAQNISSHFLSLHWITEHDINFVIFDYPGYGASEGTPTPENTVEAAKLYLNWTKSKYPDVPLVALGQSLGGAVMMRAVTDIKDEVQPCLVVIDSSFESYQEIARWALGQNWLTWLLQPLAYVLLSDKYSPKGRAPEIAPTPLLVMHGEADTIIPIKFGKSIFEKAKEPKTFFASPNGQHIDTFNGANATQNRKTLLDTIDNSCQFPIGI